MMIREMMSINPTRILLGTSMRQAADLFAYSNASDVAVIDAQETFVGVLSEGDLLRAMLPHMSEVMTRRGTLADSYDLFQEKRTALADQPIDAFVIRDPIVLAPTDDVHRAAAIMSARQIRRLPVVAGRKLVGTVSRADVCRAVIRHG